MRKFGRVDFNQRDMVLAARGVGVSVWVVSSIGGGGPDLILGCPRTKQNFMVELKDGSKPPSARVLTPAEATFHRTWNGQICVLESIDQMYQLLRLKP